MISSAPLKRLLEEKGLTVQLLSQISSIDRNTIESIINAHCLTKENLSILCKFLNCQPKDLIEFTDTETKGHWVWVEDKTE